MSERKPKIITKEEAERAKKPAHPLYNALTQQIGAALVVARQIEAEKDCFCFPPFVERFLDEFGRKTA